MNEPITKLRELADEMRGRAFWFLDETLQREVMRAWADKLESLAAGMEGKVVPEVVRSAPERIWLQVSDDGYGMDESFPTTDEGVTWCRDSVVACEVEYVRADLCLAMIEAAERQELACARALGAIVEDVE